METGSGGFVVTMHEGACETGSQIPRPIGRGIWCTVRTSPNTLWQQTPPELVLITIITWHFSFQPVDVSNLSVKGAYVLEALLPLLRHVVPLNDGNCRLTIPVVKGRCAREALSHAFNIGVFKYDKAPLPQQNVFTTNLRTLMEVVTLLLTAIISGIFHKQCQWLAWRVWWHALAFVTHEITWRRAYVA